MRQISNQEFADLPERWENTTVDTSKYRQVPMRAWEVRKEVFQREKNRGRLCQEYQGQYYVA